MELVKQNNTICPLDESGGILGGVFQKLRDSIPSNLPSMNLAGTSRPPAPQTEFVDQTGKYEQFMDRSFVTQPSNTFFFGTERTSDTGEVTNIHVRKHDFQSND